MPFTRAFIADMVKTVDYFECTAAVGCHCDAFALTLTRISVYKSLGDPQALFTQSCIRQ